jgi:hypothetical protein
LNPNEALAASHVQTGEEQVMESTLKRFLMVTLLLTLAAVPRRAESKVMVMAALDTAEAVAASESQAATSIGDTSNVAAASESQKESAEKSKGKTTGRKDKSAAAAILALLIPIIAIASPFVTGVLVLGIIFYFLHRRNAMLHETLRVMLEKGIPVTPELLTGFKTKDRPDPLGRRLLLPGLIMAGIGTALIVSKSDGDTSKGGLIVLFIGAAFLIVWVLEQVASYMQRKNQKNDQPPR